MIALKDTDVLHVPKLLAFEQDGICFMCDPAGPNWIATDRRGAFVLESAAQQVPIGEITRRYASAWQTDMAKAWLHVRSFVADVERARIVQTPPFDGRPYPGRSAYWPGKLRELWVHTNTSCNLTCGHCLVGSSPAGDRGLSTDRLSDILRQAFDCGVERFYFT